MIQTHPPIEIFVTLENPRWSIYGGRLDDQVKKVAEAALAAAQWPKAALKASACELNLVLSDNAAVQELNRNYRGKDKPTNVLSFALLEETQPTVLFSFDETPAIKQATADLPLMLGDVILALETIEAEAAEQKKTVLDHLTHLVVHGVLHILGYDHDTDPKAEHMERLETQILRGLGVQDPYQDVGTFLD